MAKNEPGRDPEMVGRVSALNVVFALTSIALLIVLSLMVWVDYDRPWKKYQVEFAGLETKRTEDQIQQATSKVDAARRQQVEAALAQGEQDGAAQAQEIRKAEGEKAKIDDEWYRVDQSFRFKKAEIDVVRFEYEDAAHKGRGNAAGRKQKLDDLERQWSELRTQLEDVNARRAAAGARLAELQKTKLAAEKAQKDLYAEKTRLEERLDKVRASGFVFNVRNLPVLDLANPSLKVNQIMPANLYDDVIFSPTPKVDRCTTCHLAIDRKGYEKAPQPFTTHPNLETYLQGPHPIDRIGCTVCHQGRGRATSFQHAAHTVSSVEQEKAWGKYIGHDTYEAMHYWDLPMMAKGQTEAQCAKCHQGVVEVPQAANLNAGRFLVERYGCNGCHKIKGWEGLRKVGPDLTQITAKTDAEWMFRWIKEPKGFRPTRMPQVWDVRIDETAEQKKRNDVEINSVVAYLQSRATSSEYPAPPAGDLAAGRKTFETVGCLGCHRIGDDKRGLDAFWAASYRTHGPNLDGTGTKVNAGWLYAWVKDPKSYWAHTRMPSLRLTDQEAANVTAYLMSLKKDAFRKPAPAMDKGIRDAAIKEHLLAASVPVKSADEQIAKMNDEQRTLFLGEKTIGRYGCFGCHEIKGFEKANPIGVELTEQGSKLVERLDFGYEHGQIPHTLPGWLHRKVMEPRVFDRAKVKRPEELLRMPKFFVDEQEANAIVTAIMSFTKEQVPAAAQKVLSADERYAEKGLRLIRDYNCRGCHQLGAGGGSVRKVIEAQLEESGGDVLQAQALSAPMLYNPVSKIGEGSRVHTDWLHGFLNDPSDEVRPWLELRMPTFRFDEEQLNTVTHAFAALDKVPFPYAPKPASVPETVAHGRDLFGRWQCVKCHVVNGQLPPGQEPANMAPDLAKVPERLRPEWLTLWLKNPSSIQPGTRMPSNFPDKADENAFPEVLGGDQAKQVEAVRAYLLTFGRGTGAPAGAGGR